MLRKTIKYIDYDGKEREEVLMFNLNKAELAIWGLSEKGGLDTLITRIVAEEDNQKIMDIFTDLIEKSYGRKTDDGKGFRKRPEEFLDFKESGAYSELFMELCSSTQACVDFINGLMPDDLRQQVEAKTEAEKIAAGKNVPLAVAPTTQTD